MEDYEEPLLIPHPNPSVVTRVRKYSQILTHQSPTELWTGREDSHSSRVEGNPREGNLTCERLVLRER